MCFPCQSISPKSSLIGNFGTAKVFFAEDSKDVSEDPFIDESDKQSLLNKKIFFNECVNSIKNNKFIPRKELTDMCFGKASFEKGDHDQDLKNIIQDMTEMKNHWDHLNFFITKEIQTIKKIEKKQKKMKKGRIPFLRRRNQNNSHKIIFNKNNIILGNYKNNKESRVYFDEYIDIYKEIDIRLSQVSQYTKLKENIQKERTRTLKYLKYFKQQQKKSKKKLLKKNNLHNILHHLKDYYAKSDRIFDLKKNKNDILFHDRTKSAKEDFDSIQDFLKQSDEILMENHYRSSLHIEYTGDHVVTTMNNLLSFLMKKSEENIKEVITKDDIDLISSRLCSLLMFNDATTEMLQVSSKILSYCFSILGSETDFLKKKINILSNHPNKNIRSMVFMTMIQLDISISSKKKDYFRWFEDLSEISDLNEKINLMNLLEKDSIESSLLDKEHLFLSLFSSPESDIWKSSSVSLLKTMHHILCTINIDKIKTVVGEKKIKTGVGDNIISIFDSLVTNLLIDYNSEKDYYLAATICDFIRENRFRVLNIEKMFPVVLIDKIKVLKEKIEKEKIEKEKSDSLNELEDHLSDESFDEIKVRGGEYRVVVPEKYEDSQDFLSMLWEKKLNSFVLLSDELDDYDLSKGPETTIEEQIFSDNSEKYWIESEDGNENQSSDDRRYSIRLMKKEVLTQSAIVVRFFELTKQENGRTETRFITHYHYPVSQSFLQGELNGGLSLYSFLEDMLARKNQLSSTGKDFLAGIQSSTNKNNLSFLFIYFNELFNIVFQEENMEFLKKKYDVIENIDLFRKITLEISEFLNENKEVLTLEDFYKTQSIYNQQFVKENKNINKSELEWNNFIKFYSKHISKISDNVYVVDDKLSGLIGKNIIISNEAQEKKFISIMGNEVLQPKNLSFFRLFIEQFKMKKKDEVKETDERKFLKSLYPRRRKINRKIKLESEALTLSLAANFMTIKKLDHLKEETSDHLNTLYQKYETQSMSLETLVSSFPFSVGDPQRLWNKAVHAYVLDGERTQFYNRLHLKEQNEEIDLFLEGIDSHITDAWEDDFDDDPDDFDDDPDDFDDDHEIHPELKRSLNTFFQSRPDIILVYLKEKEKIYMNMIDKLKEYLVVQMQTDNYKEMSEANTENRKKDVGAIVYQHLMRISA